VVLPVPGGEKKEYAAKKMNDTMIRCAAKNRSATMPTKNGEIIVAMASALYAAPFGHP